MEKSLFVENMDKYYAAEMTVEEKSHFLDALRGDPVLKEEFDLRIALKETITAQLDIEEVAQDNDLNTILAELENENNSEEYAENRELLEFIQKSDPAIKKNSVQKEKSTEQETPSPPKKSKNPNNTSFYLWTSLLAASVAILVIVSVPSFNVTPDTLYDRYYERFDPVGFNYRSTKQNEQAFKDAMDEFSAGNTQKAISSMLSIAGEGTVQEEIAFYLPLAYMENEEYGKAVSGLEEYIEGYSKYSFEARWYLSLAFIRNDEPGKAQEYLSSLAAQTSIYQKPARELLDRLKRL